MIEQYHHKLTNSFMLWFDNYLLTKGKAYSNHTGVSLEHYADDRIDSNYKAYGSPYKQWVFDSSIGGAIIPDGVTVGNTPTGAYNPAISGRDGMSIDFDNGRALVETTNENYEVTADFSVKDFNLYFTNETEEDLIVENKYTINSRIPSAGYGPIDPYDQVIPAVFFNTNTSNNKGFAFGGMEETTTTITATVMSEDSYMLDGVLSIFNDSRNESIAVIPMSDHPFNEFNDLKSGSYNYNDLSNQYNKCNGLYVNDVTTSKLTDRARKSLSNNIFVGFIDFEIQQHRFRHQ
tara:strand:+ start:2578 stop:3450 length:873 start_codon:yes stop_codon:yes gene_type:complete